MASGRVRNAHALRAASRRDFAQVDLFRLVAVHISPRIPPCMSANAFRARFHTILDERNPIRQYDISREVRRITA